MTEPEDSTPPTTESLRTIKKKVTFNQFLYVTTRDLPTEENEEVYGPHLPEELIQLTESTKRLGVMYRLKYHKLRRLSITTGDSQDSEEYMELEKVIPTEKDLEDGELSSDDEEVAVPQISLSTESYPSVDCELEIDRIIEETQRLTKGQNRSVSTENVAQNVASANTDTGNLENTNSRMDEGDQCEDIDIIALRTAALKSLAKKNSKEDGEVSDDSARTSPCLLKQKVVFNPNGNDGFAAEGSKTPKEKYAGLTIQVRQDSKKRDVRANLRENQRKRRHSPRNSRTRSSTRSSDKSTKKKRSISSPKDPDYSRKPHYSTSNISLESIPHKEEVDRLKTCVSNVTSHADMVLGEASNSSTDHADVVARIPVTMNTDMNSSVLPPPPVPPILPRIDRTDGGLFGIQLNVTSDIPLPRPHAPRPHDLGRDNYDSIGMDIASDNSRPTSAPGSVTFDDEAERMRKQLLQQLQQSRDDMLNASKSKASGTPERPTREGAVARNSAATGGYESSAEESYRANRAELSMVENKLQITVRQMDVIADKRRQLMKEMNALSVRLSDYQMDYLKTLEKRNSLRKDVDFYELDHIRKIRLEDNSFTDSTRGMIETDTSRVATMASFFESTSNDQIATTNSLEAEVGVAIHASKDYIDALNEHALIASSEMEIIGKLRPPKSAAVNERPLSPSKNQDLRTRARRVSSMTEDELRTLLLNNVKTTKTHRPLSDSHSLGNQASHSISAHQNNERICSVNETCEVKMELEDEQQDEYLEDDQPVEHDIQDIGVEDANQSSGISSESDTQQSNTMKFTVEKDPYSENINVNKETERARKIENECGLPVRLHYHAGLARKFNNMGVICPYEMWGLCKDFTCTYQHLNDSKLPLHTILLMILNYAPDLAGPENSHYGIREKIKKVALMKDDKETARQFVRRLLRKLPQVGRTAAFLSTENNQSTTADERGDFESYYGDLHISAASAST